MDLTTAQKRTVLAAYLGWTLDAFDFFLLTFVIKDIAKEFGVGVPEVAYALFLTLAMRFVGAFIFGRIGDKWGRKPALMLDIVCYSVIGAAAAFSPNLTIFLVLRALFGVAMGGEWGLGSSLAMESIPPQARGLVSGVLQCGYPSGFLLASVAYGLLYGRTLRRLHLRLALAVPAQRPARLRHAVHPRRGAGIAGVRARRRRPSSAPACGRRSRRTGASSLYSVVLMMAFNLFSHGTQDLYPTFLQKQLKFDSADGELDHHRRQSRRDRRRPVVRLRLGEDRPRQRDHRRGADRPAGAAAVGLFDDAADAGGSAPSSCRSRCKAPGASCRRISTNCRPARCARRCRPSSIRPAISSPPTTARSRPSSPRRTAATTPTRWRWSPASSRSRWSSIIRFSPEKRGETLHAH